MAIEFLNFLFNPITWIVTAIIFFIFNILSGIFLFLVFKMSHASTELKASFTDTPIGMFFQDNRFVDWRPVTPINGIVYDNKYGPFMVGTTYVSKKTKNIILPFDVDLDGDRTSDIKLLAETFKNISNNEKSISMLREGIILDEINLHDSQNKVIANMTSNLKFGNLKKTLKSIVPHNIKSKIEKIVSERIMKYSKVDTKQALIVFGVIFGMVVIATILLKTIGGK